MKSYVVYKHTSPSGKAYIGITCQEPEKRWKNGLGYQDSPLFFNAIKKYGWENIRHEIVCEGLSKEQAEKVEIELISKHESTDKSKGYNIASGGNAPSPSEETREKTRKKISELWANDSFKEKMRNAMVGKKRSAQASANISIAQKKRFSDPIERAKISDRQKGTHRSEEAKRKTSESMRRYFEDPNNKAAYLKAHLGVNRKSHAKSVVCVETGEVFAAVVDAEAKSGADHRNIIAVCRGKRKKAAGYHWRYANEV